AGAGFVASANYTLSRCVGLINQGQGPLNVATGFQKPVSLVKTLSEAGAQPVFDDDKGNCDNWRKHILNLTASIESPQLSNRTSRMLASGWRLSGVFRAASGPPLTIVSGADRAFSGIQAQTQRANQVGDPYGAKTVNNWFNAAAFAQPAL